MEEGATENAEPQRIWPISGVAQLCFYFGGGEQDTHFQGHLIQPFPRRCFGVMANETEPPSRVEAQCCCCVGDDKPVWYKMTIIDFGDKQEYTIVVSKKGGDYARLHSAHFEFVTTELKTDEEAKRFLAQSGRFGLSADAIDRIDPLVCLGTFSMDDCEELLLVQEKDRSREAQRPQHDHHPETTTITEEDGDVEQHSHDASEGDLCCHPSNNGQQQQVVEEGQWTKRKRGTGV